VGTAFLVLTAVLISALLPVEKAWMAMAHAISKVTTPVVLGIVYFLVVAPRGLVMRALGKNPLVHGEHDGGFWVVNAADRSGRGGMENQF
jgi:hypothetical protein